MEPKIQIMPNGVVVPMVEPLTKRELFAGMAMAAMITTKPSGLAPKDYSHYAVAYSDSLINALAASEPKGDK